MEACKEINDKPKENCSSAVNTTTQNGKDPEASKESNGNDKAKENCIPRVNAATPSTSRAKEALPRKRGKKGKVPTPVVDAEQKKRDDIEIKTFYRGFFRENKEFLFILDHNTISVTATPGREFACIGCSVQVANMKKLADHIRSEHHRFNLEMHWLSKQEAITLPTPAVLDQLDKFLHEKALSNVLTVDSISLRAQYTKEINDIFLNVPDCKVVVCGSSYHTAGLTDADLNLRIIVDEKDRNPAVFYSLISRISSSCPGKIRTRKHMYSKDYFCIFTYKNIKCEIKFFDKKHLFNAIFVESCAKFDLRVKLLFVLFRLWARSCRVINASGDTWNSLALDLMVIHFLQNTEIPVLPIFSNISLCEREVDLKAELFLYFNEWKTDNVESLASLWCKLLKFYAKDFDKFKLIISVTNDAKSTLKLDRQWVGKKFAVEDPFAPQTNILCAPSVDSYAYYCLKKTHFYFCTPQTASGPVFDFIRHCIRPNTLNVDGYAEFVSQQVLMTRLLVKALSSSIKDFESLLNVEDISHLRNLQKNWTDNYVNVCNLDVEPYDPDSTIVSLRKRGEKVALFSQDAEIIIKKFKPEHSVFEFNTESFNGGIKIPLKCLCCGKEIHPGECPAMNPPDFPSLTMISATSITEFNKLCFHKLRKLLLDSDDEFYRNKVIRDIENQIQLVFPTAILTPFGSSRNGFGLKNSDLDLCLTFTDDTAFYDCKAAETLKGVHRVLRKNRFLSHVTCISKTTVPIVKFVHMPTRLEGDVSIYNTLAITNTTLLRLYCQLDGRVQILGVMVKYFADLKHILGAPKGYLSSYAYTLMVIHFLQNCNPPVVPVLQELTADPRLPLPKVMQGENNIYFLDNPDIVRKVWPYFCLNKKSPGELWLEFLYYFGVIFDLDNCVVSIRTRKMITKPEKQWYVRSLTVEDPFRIDTNLGRGLSIKRHLDIVKCFRDELRKHMIPIQPPNEVAARASN